ncbi:hypothetical protein [Corynebacterium vitaeruminis]|uniref:hypothetical protein n=1 Tax=Corynebacterium vitaeruminis TaxID=38305 RepID=UPI00065F91EB|nr:hypothetical protein [Corynebacterium vitaeruminis]
MSTEKENTAIASLMAEIDGEADSENLVDDIMLTIFGTDVVDQSGCLPQIPGEGRLNSATLAADLGHSSENNFAEDSK